MHPTFYLQPRNVVAHPRRPSVKLHESPYIKPSLGFHFFAFASGTNAVGRMFESRCELSSAVPSPIVATHCAGGMHRGNTGLLCVPFLFTLFFRSTGSLSTGH
jgi:hypothetical protein